MIMNPDSHLPIAAIIGDAVVVLLQSNRRVTIGTILDVLEHRRYAEKGAAAENLREAIAFIRSKL